MVPDIEPAIYAQCGGQKLPLGTAISTGSSPAEARMVEKRRLADKKYWQENCWLIMASNGLNQKRAGGNQ
jgi:hypothetical protein